MPMRVRAMAMSALFVATAWPVTASTPLSARVSPATGVAPADVVVHVFVEPDARNRALSFVVESEGFYSSSTTELPGDRAPRAQDVRFRGLPAGAYDVSVTLLGSEGERGRIALIVDLW